VVKFHFTHSKLGNQSFLAERFIAKCQMLKSKWDFTPTDDQCIYFVHDIIRCKPQNEVITFCLLAHLTTQIDQILPTNRRIQQVVHAVDVGS